jgi:hypothetical protein
MDAGRKETHESALIVMVIIFFLCFRRRARRRCTEAARRPAGRARERHLASSWEGGNKEPHSLASSHGPHLRGRHPSAHEFLHEDRDRPLVPPSGHGRNAAAAEPDHYRPLALSDLLRHGPYLRQDSRGGPRAVHVGQDRLRGVPHRSSRNWGSSCSLHEGEDLASS